MKRLESKVAIVTGAAGGMGKQIAITFAREGADIAIGDMADMISTVKEVKDLGRKIVAVPTDISKKAQAVNLIETALKEFKKVDCC